MATVERRDTLRELENSSFSSPKLATGKRMTLKEIEGFLGLIGHIISVHEPNTLICCPASIHMQC